MRKTEETPVIWLQAASCSGCSVSVLNSVDPTIANLLLDEVLPGQHISLMFQATVMGGAGEPVLEILESAERDLRGQFILLVEGSVPTARNGVFGTLGDVPMRDRVLALGGAAQAVIALGTCASFGGMFAAPPNPAGCAGVANVLESEGIAIPLVNIPGCPPHPAWFVGTVATILHGGLGGLDLDEYRRPKAFYGSLVHENCPRRASFDEGKFARYLSDEGCLYELGCKGTVTHSDCSLRRWNNSTNWVIGSGAPCNGCVEPDFPDLAESFYGRIQEEPLLATRQEAKR
jgi:hydrogenase small subunit